jgi:histidine kinase
MTRMRIDEVEIRDADIFEILLDHFPDMIHSVDDQGNIVYTNRTAEALLGYTRDELQSMNVRDIYAPRVQDALEKGFSDLKQEGDKEIPESWLQTKDGEEIPVEIRSFSIYDDEGAFIRTFSILRDIRQLKELQSSLVHAGRLAAIGELSSGVAHDINNPLTVIMLSNDMLLKELAMAKEDPSNIDVDRMLFQAESTKKASLSIQKLADHLRNFSRGMAEKAEVLDYHSCVEDALFMTHSKIGKSSVTVKNEVPEGKHFVTVCSNHMEQVLVNLVANACDALQDGEERVLTLSISEAKLEDVDCWSCNVADTGTGIPEDILEDIFGSFFTTKPEGEGTGLGLSISRGIIRDYQGDITVSSEASKGTTFSVLLPKTESPMK